MNIHNLCKQYGQNSIFVDFSSKDLKGRSDILVVLLCNQVYWNWDTISWVLSTILRSKALFKYDQLFATISFSTIQYCHQKFKRYLFAGIFIWKRPCQRFFEACAFTRRLHCSFVLCTYCSIQIFSQQYLIWWLEANLLSDCYGLRAAETIKSSLH